MKSFTIHPIDRLEPESVLVVGGDGLIGNSLTNTLSASGWLVKATSRRKSVGLDRVYYDLSNGNFNDLISNHRAAVLCAGITSMPYCRRDPLSSRQVNVANTVQLARHLLQANIHVIFISSNTVFDGNIPFTPASTLTSPRTEYGRQKADAENLLLNLPGPITIIRLSKVVSDKTHLLNSWVKDLRSGLPIYPYEDYIFSPLSLTFVSAILLKVIETGMTGIVQASASRDITYAEAARHLANIYDFNKDLILAKKGEDLNLDYSPPNTTLEPTGLADLGLTVPDPLVALNELINLADL